MPRKKKVQSEKLPYHKTPLQKRMLKESREILDFYSRENRRERERETEHYIEELSQKIARDGYI